MSEITFLFVGLLILAFAASYSAEDSARRSAESIALQSDGKIIVETTFAGAYLSSHHPTLLLKYNSRLLGQSAFSFAKTEFVAHPNPVIETINIDFTLSQSEALEIDLYSNDDRKVVNLMENRDFQAGFNSQQLDFPGALTDGVCFLKVSYRNDAVTIEIVK